MQTYDFFMKRMVQKWLFEFSLIYKIIHTLSWFEFSSVLRGYTWNSNYYFCKVFILFKSRGAKIIYRILPFSGNNSYTVRIWVFFIFKTINLTPEPLSMQVLYWLMKPEVQIWLTDFALSSKIVHALSWFEFFWVLRGYTWNSNYYFLTCIHFVWKVRSRKG